MPRLDVRPARTGDGPWTVTLAACTAIELTWWLVCWSRGLAPLPHLFTYVVAAVAGVGTAWSLRLTFAPRRAHASWTTVATAAALVAIGASVFLPLKFAIPKILPFWLDAPLASGERLLFGTDPWLLLDRLFGGAAAAVDRIYALWLPIQVVVLFAVVLATPSHTKSRLLIAYSLAWLLLGVGAALALSSAGPLFYDRLFGTADFAALEPTLRARGAWLVLAESDQMWSAYAHDTPGLVAGISALPSLHVAISVWIYLAARAMAPRAAPAALAYALFMWVASVQLGWHYVADGLAGALGTLALWGTAGWMENAMAGAGRRSFVDSGSRAPTEK